MHLVLLAQQGTAGRAEANRLIWTWIQPKAAGSGNYAHAPAVYQAAIRNARHGVDKPPESHMDWNAWAPGHALGPHWALKADFLMMVKPPGPPPPVHGAAPGADPGVVPGQNTMYHDLKPGDARYPQHVPGNSFNMSTFHADSGWWTEGWWQALSGTWVYRVYD